jgi:opacity protein-like surface antigen
MKKLLIVFSLTLFSCQTLANSAKSNFYLKGIMGLNKMNEAIEKNTKTSFNLKQEAIPSPFVGVGMGYYINDQIRTDLTFNYYSPFFITESANFNYYNSEDNINVVGGNTVTRKAIIKSIMLSGFYDIINKKSFAIFIGAGIGSSHIKEKVSTLSSGNISNEQQIINFPLDVVTSNTKVTNNLAYSFTIGTSIKVYSNINLELAYHWKNFGKTNPQRNINGDLPTQNRYKGHNISVGVRLDI